MQDALHCPQQSSYRASLERVLTTRPPLLWQIAFCAAALAIVVSAGWEIHDDFHLTPVLLCLVSSVFLALISDFKVALVNSLASAIVADYLFIGPVGKIETDVHFFVRAFVFSGTSLLVNLLVGSLRHTFLIARSARESAENANKEKDEIMAILAHDLRAPLTAAQLSLQMIERGDASDTIRRQTRRAREACQRLNTLVLDLLDSSKAAAGGLSLHREHQDVVVLARRVFEEFRLIAAEAGISLESQFADSILLYCDATRISQLLSNLLGNAMKFTPRGGTVRLTLAQGAEATIIAVSDTGVGMTPEQQQHLFERFWQAERSNRSGVGLGLFIVKAIVNSHGGKIYVESVPNQGTKFTVCLPSPQ